MAIKPTQEEARRLKNTAQRARQRKIKAQAEIGHGTDFTAHHPGVIPEDKWQAIKAESEARKKAEGIQ